MKRIFLIALGCVFIVGIVVGGIYAYTQIHKQLRAQNWVEVPVHFDDIDTSSNFSLYGTKYHTHCKYRYEYEGEEFVGDTLSFDFLAVDSKEKQEKIVRNARNKATCWVNPDNPSQSVIFNETGVGPLVIFSFILFWGITLAGACFAFADRSANVKRKRENLRAENKLVFKSPIVFNHLIALCAANLFLAVGVGTFRTELGVDLTSGAALWIGANILAQIAVVIYNRKCARLAKSVVIFTAFPGDAEPVKCEIQIAKPLPEGGDFFAAIRFSARSEKNMSKRVLLGEFVLDLRKQQGANMFCEADTTQPDTLTIQLKIGWLSPKYIAPHSDNEHLMAEIARELMFAKVPNKEERGELAEQLVHLLSVASDPFTEMIIVFDSAHVEEELHVEFWSAGTIVFEE